MEHYIHLLKSSGCEIDENFYLKKIKEYRSKEELEKEITNYIKTFIETNSYGIKDISVALGCDNYTYFYNYKESILYDLASITKLFTLKVIYDLEKEHKIDWNTPINTYLEEFDTLKDYTIMDAIQMRKVLETDGKLADTKDYGEFIKVLKTVRIKDNKSVYADIGHVLLGKVIEKVTKKDLKTHFKETIFDKYSMNNTCFLPKNNFDLKGNGNALYLPHDFKTRIANGMTGAAGIFSNVYDLVRFSKELLNGNVFDKEFLDQIYDYTFIDTINRNRSFSGLYKKTNKYRSYVPKEFSNFTLAHQGFTGSVWISDLKLHITQVFLFDAIEMGEKEKHPNFFQGFYTFRDRMSEYSILLYLMNI